jgi:hypothetical protein
MLHVTNGDTAVHIMKAAAIGGEMLPWRDVLHEGPVPAGLTLQQLSERRAQFIAGQGWGSSGVLPSFRARDETLSRFAEHDEVVLWFEHDLYDQLQLIQLLDWFAQQALGSTRLSLVCRDQYLGRMTPARLGALYPQRAGVTARELELGRRAWSAFCAPEPTRWLDLLQTDTSALPYLAGAVVRHLQQYPSAGNGANRTEAALLAAVDAGVRRPGRLFERVQAQEERVFMGDSLFWSCLRTMADSSPALLRLANDARFRLPEECAEPALFREQEILITAAGSRVLAGTLDWTEVAAVDKWLGGVHLTAGNLWRWDDGLRTMVAP